MRVCPECGLIYQHPTFTQCGLHSVDLNEQDEDPLVGNSLDRYTIMSLLGAGSMGRVYQAFHAGLGRTVAVKVLYGDHVCGGAVRARFEREAQAIGQIDHPNVVAVTDFGCAGARYFLVMEHLDGRTLDVLIDQRAPLSPLRTSTITMQIASGLAAAHQHGFVHRDLKPANIFVGNNEDEVVKILDFGLVGMMSMGHGDRITRAGHVIGTPMYMAPEQTTSPAVDPSADLYSLGVIIYEMLAGRPPFLERGRLSMMLAHVQNTPPTLPGDGSLERLCFELLSKRPEDRPADAQAVVDALRRLEEEVALLNEPTLVVDGSDRLDPVKEAARTDPELLALDAFPPLPAGGASPSADVWSVQVAPAIDDATLDQSPVARAVVVEPNPTRAEELKALLGDRFEITIAPNVDVARTLLGNDLFIMRTLPPKPEPVRPPPPPAPPPPRKSIGIVAVALAFVCALLVGFILFGPGAPERAIPLDVTIDRQGETLEVTVGRPGYHVWRHAVDGRSDGRTEVSATLLHEKR